MTPQERWAALAILQAEYADFKDFMYDVWMEMIGVPPTDIQLDIGDFLQSPFMDIMVQAQRGEAKTTITGTFGVWDLIHNPSHRILVFSAGSKMSNQVANWIIQIIMTMPQLACLRPSTSISDGMRQRTATDAFDIHYALKGPEKSPSVACLGITSNMQGYRADILIADDVESSKNSLTELMREQLANYCKDFPSICSNGRIIYLGTPQSTNTIYNGLPAQGFEVRIWPGRFPTREQLANYGPHLAPLLLARMAANPALMYGGGPLGDQGQPTDPVMFSEDALSKKELKQGTPYFQLQHMLNAKLSDSERYPLKLDRVMFMSLDPEKGPGSLTWGPAPSLVVPMPQALGLTERAYRPAKVHDEFFPYSAIIMAVDPAGGGQNGDETGYAIVAFLHGYLFVLDIGGVPGGHDEEKMLALAKLARKWRVTEVVAERNYGNGAYTALLTAALRHPSVAYPCTVSEVYSTGQKELRIIDAIEPVLGRRRLVFNECLLKDDADSLERYASGQRTQYSFWWQFTHITRDKRALRHDDRVDALAIAVRHIVDKLAVNDNEYLANEEDRKLREFMKNPLSLPHYITNGYDPCDAKAVARVLGKCTSRLNAIQNSRGKRRR